MNQFIHIDQSLCCVGGHEYDCAVNTLRAAQASGYLVRLATNRRFRDRSELPRDWPVYPLFPHKAYSRHCLAFGRRDHDPLDLDGRPFPPAMPDTGGRPRRPSLSGAAGAKPGFFTQISRSRQVCRFATACRELFAKVALCEGDQVFLATVSEFDLLGLTRYLARHAESRAADWHLQFHFDLFTGCPPDGAPYESRRIALQTQFQYVLDQLANHRIHWYGTTEQLTAQYQQLGAAPFQHLSYPVNPALSGWTRPAHRPLRITCAGGMRQERGFRELEAIVETLQQDRFFDGQVEIVAQPGKKRQRRLRAVARGSGLAPAEVRVTSLPHPLRSDAYYELIRDTDIACSLHDAQRYALQCSGVLQEMLAAGKPVIVPAATWLAQQIAEPLFEHVDTLRRTLPLVSRVGMAQIPGTDSAATRPGSSAADFQVPPAATEIALAFRTAEAVAPPCHTRVQTEQFDRHGLVVDRFESVVSRRSGNRLVPVLIHLVPGAVRIAVRFRCAELLHPPLISDLEAAFLEAREDGGCPAGSVGLIAARPALVPALLRDMVAHYDHYRATAEEFSHGFLRDRHPARTVEVLTENSRRALAARARSGDRPRGAGELSDAVASVVAEGSNADREVTFPSRGERHGPQAA